jgi:chitodextrinase
MAKRINIRAYIDSLGDGPINIIILALIFAIAISILCLVINIGIFNSENFAVDSSSAIPIYDDTKVYNTGSIVNFNGALYEMVQSAGTPNHPPLKLGEQYWQVMYDNSAVYNVGDTVRFNGDKYIMVKKPPAAGYPPQIQFPRVVSGVDNGGDVIGGSPTPPPANNSPLDSSYWKRVYDNSKVYQVGDQVYYTDGNVYVMVRAPGSAGYTPLRPGDQFWKTAYDDKKIYRLGDQVYFTDRNVYIMVESAGVAGYPPLRPGDQLWKKVVGMIQPYDNTVVYQIGNLVKFTDNNIYLMVNGTGAAGYAPLRIGDTIWWRVS